MDDRVALCLQMSTSMRGYKSAKFLEKMGYRVILAYFGKGESLVTTRMDEIDKVIDLSKKPFSSKIGVGPFTYRGLKRIGGERRTRQIFGHYTSLFPYSIRNFLKWIGRNENIELVQVLGYPDGPLIPAVKILRKRTVFDFRDLSTGLEIDSIKNMYDNKIMKIAGLDNSLAKWHIKKWRYHEKKAVKLSDGLLFASAEMQMHIAKKYGLKGKKPMAPFENRPFLDDIPVRTKKKLSRKDSIPNICYIGGISLRGYRNYIPLFRRILESGYHLHVYSSSSSEIKREYERKLIDKGDLNIYDGKPPLKLQAEITRYDYGLVPFLMKKDILHVDFALPNKFFEYLTSGLRIIATPIRSIKRMMEQDDIGFVYPDLDTLPKLIETDWDNVTSNGITIDRKRYTMEAIEDELKDFYSRVGVFVGD